MDNEKLRAEYRRMFDEIKASDALRERVLSQKPKRRNMKPVFAAMSTAAAALVIFAAVRNYSFDDSGSGVISETTVSSTQTPETQAENDFHETENAAAATEEKPLEATAPVKKTPGNYKYEASKSMSTLPPAEVKRAAEASEQKLPASVPDGYTAKTAAPAVHTEAALNDTDGAAVNDPGGAAEPETETPGGALVLQVPSGRVTLRMNSRSALDRIMSSQAQAKTAAVNMYTAGETEYHTEKWDNEKYFDYLGIDIVNDVALAEDMKYEGDEECYFTVDESGTPKNDSRIFAFSGDNGRYASILTSKDTTVVDSVLDSPEIEKGTIENIEAAAFQEDLSYSFYAKSEDVGYVITTEELSGQEVADLLTSIGD